MKALYQKLAFAHPKATICFVLLFAAFFLFYCTKLYQAADVQDQLDPQLQSTKDFNHLQETFSSANGLVGIVISQAPWNNAALCKMQRALIAVQNVSPKVETIFSPFSVRTTKSDLGHLFYPAVLQDPCEKEQKEQDLAFLQKTPWHRYLTDSQGKKFIFALSLAKNEKPGKYGSFDPDLVKKVLNTVTEKLPGHPVQWLGTQVSQYYMTEGLQQSQLLNLLILCIVILLFRYSFGTWKSSFVFLLTVGFLLTVVFGGMALLEQPVDIIAVSLFLILMVSSLEDFVFLSQFQCENPQLPLADQFQRFVGPSFYTSLTSAVGFGSLLISDLQGVRRFGAWAAVGTMLEWVTVFFFLPAFLNTIFPAKAWTNAHRSSQLPLKNLLLSKYSHPLLAKLFLLVIPLGVCAIPFFNLSQTPSEVFPHDHPLSRAIESARQDLGWISEVSLVFASDTTEEKKKEILQTAAQDPLVAAVETKEAVIQTLISTADPLRQDLIRREFASTPLAERYESKMGESRALLRLTETNTEIINVFRQKVESLCPKRECYLAGESVAFADSSRAVIQTLYESLFLSLVLVSLILGYLCYRKKYSFINFTKIILSSVWGSFALLVIIFLFGIHLNIITCIVATVLVGLTGDNAVQFIYAGEGDLEGGMDKRSTASVFCSLTMAIISLVFLGSYFEPPRTLGVLLSAGFLIALFGDVWLLKGLLHKPAPLRVDC